MAVSSAVDLVQNVEAERVNRRRSDTDSKKAVVMLHVAATVVVVSLGLKIAQSVYVLCTRDKLLYPAKLDWCRKGGM